MKLNKINGLAIRRIKHTNLLIKKSSPEILLFGGILGVITSTILACRATLNVQETIAQTNDTIDLIKANREISTEEIYEEEAFQKDLAVAKVYGAMNLVRLYVPSVIVGSVSIGALIGSHHILNQRNMALISAYKLVDEAFKKYRKRVIESVGEDGDNYFRYGGEKKDFKLVERKKKEKVDDSDTPKCMLVGDEDLSMYAKFFDSSSPQWKKTSTLNYFFLRGQQAYANDMLKVNGHVFLNEVYDSLGIPRTKAGAIVGWIYNSEKGDNFIDFNIHNPLNELNRDFVNGYENAILLDFNVDGIIYDLI